MQASDDLRFPIGRCELPAASTPELRSEQIETIRLLPERLRAAVHGLSESQIDTPYREGGWTVRQLVHHVFDSHANSYVRFKLALTEDWPEIKLYDEKAWAELADSKMPVEVSLALLDGLHQRWVVLLKSMTDEDFEKGLVHPKMGRQQLGMTLAVYDWHSRHHTAHITALRSRQGW